VSESRKRGEMRRIGFGIEIGKVRAGRYWWILWRNVVSGGVSVFRTFCDIHMTDCEL